MNVSITGMGIWTPGFASVEAWRARTPDPAVVHPSGGWIERRQLRRSTALARMAGHALADALAQAGRAPDEVCLLTASVGGELACTFANLELLVGEPPSSSPLRFGNSVHNAALGHLAISAGNRHTASAIAVQRGQLAAMGLLEAAAHVLQMGTDAAVVFVEETWPGADFAPSAVALVLSHEGGLGTLSAIEATPAQAPVESLPDTLSESPAAASLHLLDRLHQGEGRIPLATGDRPWSAHWSPT